jgi:hypothetical protein
MNKIRLITASLLSIIAATVATAAETSRYELDVKDFTELKVIEGLNVDYKFVPDSAGKAVFTTTPDLASVVMISNNNGKLELQISTDGIDYAGLPTITVYSNFLTRVENSGDSTVRVLSVAATPTFKAKVIGNGKIVVRDITANQLDATLETGNGQLVLYGSCQSAKYSLTGSGSIQADDLKAATVKCRTTGTGTIGCRATEQLTVVGMGSGKVYYAGNPQKITRRSVGIKLVPLDEECETPVESSSIQW